MIDLRKKAVLVLFTALYFCCGGFAAATTCSVNPEDRILTAEEGTEATAEEIESNAWTKFSEAITANGGLVRIVTDRDNGYVIGEDASNKLRLQVLDKKDLRQVWKVSKSGAYYLIQNLATGRYIDRATGYVGQLGTTTKSLAYRIGFASGATMDKPLFNFFHQNQTNYGWYYDGTSDYVQLQTVGDGEGWGFCVVAAVDVKSVTPESGKTYRIQNVGRPGFITMDAATGYLKKETSSTSYSQYWLLESADNENFSFKNVLTGEYIQKAAAQNEKYTTDATEATFGMMLKQEQPHRNAYSFVDADVEGIHASSNGTVIRYSCNNETSSYWYFEEVSLTEEDEAKMAEERQTFMVKLHLAKAVNFGLVRFVSEREGGHVIGEDASKLRLCPLDEKDLTQVWKVTRSGTNYIFQNLVTGRYIDRATGAVAQLGTVTSAMVNRIEISSDATTERPLFNFFHQNASLFGWYYDGVSDYVQLKSIEAGSEGWGFSIAAAKDLKSVTPEVGKTYRIHNIGRPGFLALNEASGTVVKATSTDSYSQYWQLVSVGEEGGVALKNVLTEQYMQKADAQNEPYAMGTEEATFTLNLKEETFYRKTYNITDTDSEGLHAANDGTAIIRYSCTKQTPSDWYFEEVALTNQQLWEIENSPWHRLRIALETNNGIVRLVSGKDNAYVAEQMSESMMVAESAEGIKYSQLWRLEAQEGGGYTIRSMSSGKYVQAVTANSIPYPLLTTGSTFYIKGSTIDGFSEYFFISSTTNFANGTCFHHDDANRVVRWNANSGESSWKIEAVSDVTLEELENCISMAEKKEEVMEALPPLLSHHGLVRIFTDRDNVHVIADTPEDATHRLTMKALDKEDLAQVWMMTGDEHDYSFRNVATGRYIDYSSTTNVWIASTLSSRIFYVNGAEGATKEAPFFNLIHPYTDDVCLHYRTKDGAVITNTTDRTPGSGFRLESATDVSLDEVQESLRGVLGWDIPKADTYYRIVNKASLGMLKENETTVDDVTSSDGTIVVQASNTSLIQYWQLVSTDGGMTYALKNLKTGKYLQQSTGSSMQYEVGDNANATFTIRKDETTHEPWYNIVDVDGEGLNRENDNQVKRGALNTDGARWRFEAVDAGVLNPPTTFYTVEELLESHSGLVVFRSPVEAHTGKVITPQSGGGMRLEMRAPNLADPTHWGQVWLMETVGTAYTFRNLKTGEYINGNTLSKFKSNLYIQKGPNTEHAYNIGINSSFPTGSDNCLHVNKAEGIVLWKPDTGPHSEWYLEPAGFSLATEEIRNHFDGVNGCDEPLPGKIYRIICRANGNLITENFSSRNMQGKEDLNSPTQFWRIIDAGDGIRYIQNVSSRNYINSTTKGLSIPVSTKTDGYYLLQRGEYDSYYFIADDAGGNNGLQHGNANQNYYIAQWSLSDTDERSKWYFQEVELTEEEIAAAEKEYDDYMVYNEGFATTSERFFSFFSDELASVVKPEYAAMSDDDLREQMADLPRELHNIVLKAKNNTYEPWEKEFRMAKYGAFSNPNHWTGRLKTRCWGVINNPTGIIADSENYVFIIVGNDVPENAVLAVETRLGYRVDGGNYTQYKTLTKGLNVLYVENDNAELYIRYESPQDTPIADCPVLDIHIEGGHVNGYFDINKHSDADWVSMRKEGLFFAEQINLLGNFAQLRIQTTGATQNGDKISPLVEVFDWFVELQLDIMGITGVPDSLKNVPGAAEVYEDLYPKMVNNRMLSIGDPSLGLYGTSYHIALGGDGCYRYSSLKNRDGSSWAAAHEYGHVNQHAIHLAASTEISNNFFSNMTIYRGGTSTSRGWNLQTMQERFERGLHSWPGICGNIWLATQMYYSLYLYYHAAGNDPLFYQKLFKLLRENPLTARSGSQGCTGAEDYLHFARMASDAAGEDLTDFFEYWGFFVPVDSVRMSCYQTWYMTTTEEMIAEAKAYMARHLKKCNAGMVFIDDRVVPTYKADGSLKTAFGGYPWSACTTDFPGAQYSAFDGKITCPTNMAYTVDETGKVTLNAGAEGASGIKFYDKNGTLAYVAASDEFTIPSNLQANIDHSKTVIALPDGTVMPLYSADDEDVYMQTIHHGTGSAKQRSAGKTVTIRYTKGDDAAVLSAERDGANAVALIATENTVPETLSATTNVGINGMFNTLELTDNADFAIEGENELLSKSITYTDRKLWQGWNTVCLPFAVAVADFGDEVKIEVLDTEDSSADMLYFKQVKNVVPGQPCLVWVPNDMDWRYEKTNEEGLEFVGYPQLSDGVFYMNGSFATENIGAGHYKMNTEGTAFGMTSAKGMIYPFRAYVSPTETSGAASIRVRHIEDDSTTGIKAPVLKMEGADCYDLQGRKVLHPNRGQIYILGGRKVLFK